MDDCLHGPLAVRRGGVLVPQAQQRMLLAALLLERLALREDPGAGFQQTHWAILTVGVILGGRQTAPFAGVAPGPSAPRQLTVVSQRPAAPRQLPAAVRHFTGRAAELKALTSLLDQIAWSADCPGTAVVSAIGGPAGVGKTALALHWAHQVADSFPDGQLYLDLCGVGPTAAPMTPAEAVRKLLDALGVPVSQVPADADAQAGLYRGLLSGKRMLIVLDNARDAEQVRPLLPASPASLVMVTSRSQLTGLVAADGAHPLVLDVLAIDEARDLLVRCLGAERVAADPAATDELIRLCAHLPLALTVAAARASIRPGLPLAALNAELRDVPGRLDALDAGDPATNVRAVFSWSCQNLTTEAARMFRYLGCHPGADISVRAAASLAGLPAARARTALVELASASLITEHVPGRFTCHDLLRAYAAEQAAATDSAACRWEATHRLLDHYLHTAHSAAALLFPGRGTLRLDTPCPGMVSVPLEGYQQAWEWLDAECETLLATIAFAHGAGFDTHAWQIAWALTEFLDRHSRWHDWSASMRTALAAASRLGDLDAQGRTHRDLGLASAKLGHHDKALTELRRALECHQRTGDRCGLARVHYARALVYELRGDRRRAIGEAWKALELYRAAKHAGGEARALNLVGWAHAMLGDYGSAVTLCEQAIAKLRELGDWGGEADTWDSLGYAHQHLGHHAEAVACYTRAVNPFHDLGDRRSEARSLTHIGDTHQAAGSPRAARAAWRRALAIFDEISDPGAGQVRARLRHQPG